MLSCSFKLTFFCQNHDSIIEGIRCGLCINFKSYLYYLAFPLHSSELIVHFICYKIIM
jgi:hypothetical protein